MEILSKYPTLSSPPIWEAILEIQFEKLPNEVLKKFETILSDLSEIYNSCEKIQQISSTIPFDDETSINNEVEDIGFGFLSSNNSDEILFKTDTFTYKVKKNTYTNWQNFKESAINYFNRIVQLSYELKIKRISIRYINLIKIPLPINDFKDYILTIPDISPTLPQSILEMFMKLVIPFDEKSFSIVSQTFNVLSESTIQFVFDIDAIQDNLNCSHEDIWNEFDKLREIKNQVFFNSITDKTLKLFI